MSALMMMGMKMLSRRNNRVRRYQEGGRLWRTVVPRKDLDLLKEDKCQ